LAAGEPYKRADARTAPHQATSASSTIVGDPALQDEWDRRGVVVRAIGFVAKGSPTASAF
jgi:hypothetical protein